MEVFGTFLDEEWESLSKMFSVEDSDFTFHCEGNNSMFSKHENPGNNLLFPSDHHALIENTNFYRASQESSNSSEFGSGQLSGRAGDDSHFGAGVNVFHAEQNNTTFVESMDFCCQQNNEGLMLPFFSDDMMEEILQLKAEILNEKLGNANADEENGKSCMRLMEMKRKFETPGFVNSSDCPKKKPRVSKNEQKNKRNSHAKRSKKDVQIINKDEEMKNAGGNGQSSISTCSSEEDSLSNDLNGGSDSKLASNGKSKAGRGPATDPQSIYARKRRERINERLKILQNLVPNGTKVDISTMLEEAVSYVKFLQLQIKLLSSDDMWMYAPIAYNGMDIGLYQKIVPTDQWPHQN